MVLADGSIEPAGSESLVPTEVTSKGRLSREIHVDACPAGCWLVLGEGFNEAWEASAPGLDLGAPVPVDGGFNGWWIPPSDSGTTVTISWAAQRSVTIGFVVSGVAILVALALVIFTRRRRGDAPVDVVDAGFTLGRGQVSQSLALVAAIAGTVAAVLLIKPDAALWVGAVGALVAVTRRPRLAAYAALATACFVGLAVINTVRRDRPAPSGGWIVHMEWLHTHALTVVVLALMAAIGAPATRTARACRRGRSAIPRQLRGDPIDRSPYVLVAHCGCASARHGSSLARPVDRTQLRRSMIIAIPWPPPTHIVSRPNCLSSVCRLWIRVVMMRAPVIPNG